jgi:hypothetical protein
MRRHYNVKCRPFIQWSVTSFQHIPREHLTHLLHLGKSSIIPLQSGSFSLSSSWTLLCTVTMNKASTADKSRSVTHYFNKISPSNRATLKSVLDVFARPVRSSSLTSDHIRTRCTIWHETLSLRQYHTRLSTEGWISIGDTCFAHTNRITLRTSSQNHVSNAVATAHQLIPRIASDLLLRQLLRVTATTCASPYRKMQCLLNTKLTGLRNLLS